MFSRNSSSLKIETKSAQGYFLSSNILKRYPSRKREIDMCPLEFWIDFNNKTEEKKERKKNCAATVLLLRERDLFLFELTLNISAKKKNTIFYMCVSRNILKSLNRKTFCYIRDVHCNFLLLFVKIPKTF